MPAKPNIAVQPKHPVTAPALSRAEMERLVAEYTAKIHEDDMAKLEPNKERVNELLAELQQLVVDINKVDIAYIAPFTMRQIKLERTEENILAFLADGGKTTTEVQDAFSGAPKAINEWLDKIVTDGVVAKDDKVPKESGRGFKTVFTVPAKKK